MPLPPLYPVHENFLKTVIQKYNRNEDSLNEDVATLKKWMQNQPHLPEVLDDSALRNFLIMNKCSVEKAKQRIDMYYTIRSLMPDIYDTINPKIPEVKRVLDTVYYVPLPKLTKENYRVFIYKVRNPDLMEFLHPHQVVQHMNNLQEIRLREDVIYGEIAIFDLAGPTFSYLTKYTPTVMARTFAIYEKVWSIPLKGMYIINSHPLVVTIQSVLKTILKPKIFERIRVCQDTSLLKELLPKDTIPKEYGGDGESLEELQELMEKKIQEYQDRYDRLDKLRVDESKRPAELKNDEILGFHGNFKKLSVD